MEAIIFGIILSADSFSAALSLGFKSHTKKDAFKFATVSGGSEALVTFLGAMAGAKIVANFSQYDHWIAFFLLLFVAIHMLIDAIKEIRSKKVEDKQNESFHHFFKILIVSLATSLDGLGVGVGLGVMGKPLPSYIISIGICAFLATLLGLFLARKMPRKFAPYFTFSGALILVIIAFRMLEI